MVWKNIIALTSVLLFSGLVRTEDVNYEVCEEAGKRYLAEWNEALSKLTTASTQASWDYESNITDYNLERQLAAAAKLAKFNKEEWKQYPWKTYKDPDTRRQFQKYSFLGVAVLPTEKFERLEKVIKEMEKNYAKAKICDYRNGSKCDLYLEPEITELFANSRDPEELKYIWTEWRKASGRPVRKLFSEYVLLSNEAARLNNYSDTSEVWLKDYESDDFTKQVEDLWQQVRPLYVQLHAYVRRRLREQYGENVVSKTGPIPAHLLGNMWAQTWNNILNYTVPYPNKPSLDVTSEMVQQKYTPLKMFKVAEEFFTSLGLKPMPETFWKNSIIEKPSDGRDLICHASAWDFYDGEDFRIKQCTRVNLEDLQTVHHEMGHVQYFLQYKHQPIAYKEGANPGFHEAVGDVMALSVSTPKHIQKIGLLKDVVDDQESEINQLFGMALNKVAFLPFGYLMDQWRWGVFKGKITESNYNCKWWELREQYQGIQPPTKRSEEDFDPGAKYHINGGIPYIRYFVSFIIQFQFHRSLCIAAGEFDPENPGLKPLHKCDIYQNKKAGELLGKMLEMGSSKPWPDAMEVLTGQRKMDAGALLQYFSTLQTWLERENARTGEYIGWEPTSRASKEERLAYYDLEEPDDSSEDDNFDYSYAELVPQSANSFESTGYRVNVEPRLNPMLRKPTMTKLELDKNMNLLFKTNSPKKQGERLSKKREKSERYRGGLKYAKRNFRSRPVVRMNLINTDKDLNSKPTDNEEEYGKPQQSSLSKLLLTLSSSLSRPMGTSAEKSLIQMEQSGTNSLSSDLWNSEMMRIQAEEILKSYDINDDQSDSSEMPKAETSSQIDVLVTDNQLKIDEQDPQMKYYQFRNMKNYDPEDFLPSLGKKTAKKSFTHYHYNVRTPVFYNAVVLKKPSKSNNWMDNSNKAAMTCMTVKNHDHATLSGCNMKNSDRWKTVNLIPVDRKRMIMMKQYMNDAAGDTRKRRIKS